MKPSFVKRIAIRTLGNLESFITGSRVIEGISRTTSRKEGNIVGLYVNAKNSFLVITELGIRVFQDGLDDFFLYTEISQITSPECVDRDLDLVLEGDRFDDIRAFSFPVLGVTNDFPDIEVFYEFLLAVLEKLQISPINLRSIRTIDDFIDYLRTECEWETYTEALANYLEREFDPACFDRLKIDKILLDTPDFWRALAVILNIPIRLPLELVRAPDEFDNTAQFKNDEDGG